MPISWKVDMECCLPATKFKRASILGYVGVFEDRVFEEAMTTSFLHAPGSNENIVDSFSACLLLTIFKKLILIYFDGAIFGDN